MSPKNTQNIGFFLDESIRQGISSPYYSLVFKAMENIVKKVGFNLLLFSDPEDMHPLKNQKKIDGVIICSFPRLEKQIQEIKKFLPIVLIDNNAADKSIPSVTINNFNACSESAQYLISIGHKRIGFISGLLDSDICKDRLNGYLNGLSIHDFKDDKSLIYKGDYSYESGEKAAKYFLSLPQPPTAIMCANDSMAIGAMKVIQENKFNIPNDISVVGFDDIEVSARMFPALTTNTAPIEQIAQKAVNILISSINGTYLEYKHVILPAKLTLRGSTAPVKQ
jgi:DNA-binding LacI/PurR family transcriptional regulator